MKNTPRMNKAANESIAEIYKTGCQIEIELAEALEWKRMLSGWGGTPGIVDSFIKGQQERINSAQEAEKQRDALLSSLVSMKHTEPCNHNGDLFYPRHSPDGDYLGEEPVDPISLLGALYTMIYEALASVKGGDA